MDSKHSKRFVNILIAFILYTSHLKPSPSSSLSTTPTTSTTSSSSSSSSSFFYAEATQVSTADIRAYNIKFDASRCVTATDPTQGTSLTAKTRVECVVVCMNRPTCLSVAFNTKTRLCYTNDLTLSSPGAGVNYDEDFLYTEIAERIEWHLALRATSGIGVSVYNTWGNTNHHDDVTSVTSDTIGCLTVDGRLPCDKHLRTWRLDDWDNVALVKHAFYTDSQQVFYVTFDATGITSATRDDHFRIARIVDSSATQVVGFPAGSYNFDSIYGHHACSRHFFLNAHYRGCPDDVGWMFVSDSNTGCCTYEQVDPLPKFMYAPQTTAVNWMTGNVGKAQVFAVFIKYTD